MSEFTSFSDDDDATAPDGWLDVWHENDDWEVEAGIDYTDNRAVTIDNTSANDGLLWTDGPDATDMEVVALTKSDSYRVFTGTTDHQGIILRGADQATPRHGYVVDLAHTTEYGLRCRVWDDGDSDVVTTELTGEEGDEDAWYWIRARIEGDNIQARVWEDSESEPETWLIDETDTTISDSGYAGVYAGSTEVDAGPYYFDVFGVGTGGEPAPTEPVLSDDQFVETFDPSDDTNTPTDWTPQLNADGSEYTVRADAGALGGAYLEINADTDEPLTWDIPGESTDVEILARHRYTDTDTTGVGFTARFDTTSEDYVWSRTTNSGHEVYSYLGGSFDAVDSTTDVSAPVDVWHLSRTRLEGDDYSYKVWADGAPEPTEWDFELSGFLSDVDGPGLVGTHDAFTGNIGELDWITVGIDGAEAPPPGEYVALTWTNNATDEEGNYVYRSDGVDPHALTEYTEIADLPPGAEGYIDDDLPEGATTLHYAVTAYDGDIEGPPVTESVVIEPDANTISGTSELGGLGVEATVFNIDESTLDIVQTQASFGGGHLLEVETGDHHVGAQFADENGQYQATSKPGVEVTDE